MAFRIFSDLQQHCQEHHSFKSLAAKLGWSSARLSAFFAGKDQCLDSVIRVSQAMDLEIDLLFTKFPDAAVGIEKQPSGE